MKKATMKTLVIPGLVLTMILGISGAAGAALTTIGTATYGGSDYNLIWDDDNNGNSVIWLDYSNAATDWDSQVAWASSLNGAGVLTYNIDAQYSVTWGGDWRLPSTVDGSYVSGYDGITNTTGWNITSSEMGHLFYVELGNLGSKDTSGNNISGYGLTNTGDFENLKANSIYWSGTEHTGTSAAWYFYMRDGYQSMGQKQGNSNYGLALLSGQVSAVPVPGAVWLLGSGLLGLIGIKRRVKINLINHSSS